MKRFLAFMLITMVLGFVGQPNEVVAQATGPDAIRWQTSFDKTLKLAKQQKKPILLEFYNPR